MSVGTLGPARREPPRRRRGAELVSQLLTEAWEHRRNRHRRLRLVGAALVAFASLLAGVLVAAHRQTHFTVGIARSFSMLTPDQELGNRCAVLNSVGCDTETFEVELKRPARSVFVSIGARSLELRPIPSGDGFPAPDEISTAGSGPWKGFYGYLLPAPSRTAIKDPGMAPPARDSRRAQYMNVRLWVTYAGGGHGTADVNSRPMRSYSGEPSPLFERLAKLSASLAAQQLRRASRSR